TASNGSDARFESVRTAAGTAWSAGGLYMAANHVTASSDMSAPPLDQGQRVLLSGARVQRVDVHCGAVVVRVRSIGRTDFLVVGAPKGAAHGAKPRATVGLVATRPPRPPDESHGATQTWREQLEGGEVVGLLDDRVVVRVRERLLLIESNGDEPGIRRIDECELAAATFLLESAREALAERGSRFVAALGESAVVAERARIALAVRRGIARVDRRVAAIRGDLERIDGAAALAVHAAAFVAEAAHAPRG